jgi:hypothetical protein
MTNDDPRHRLLGTWKLIAAVREEIPSGAKTDFLGSHPTGYINYAPDGRMMVLNVGNGRSKPAGANATPAEAEALFRSMTSYGGTYTTRLPAEQATTVTKAYLAEFILKAAAGGLTSYESLITAAVAQLPTIVSTFM